MTQAAAAESTEAAARRAIADRMRGASIEVTPRDRSAIPICRDLLPAGSAVYVTHLPKGSPREMIATAVDLRRAGLVPVPHVAARHLASFSELDDYLARAAGEAAVDRALAIAGDTDRPAGPYSNSLQMLASGLFEKHGFRTIGLAAYPEPHPRIPTPVLDSMLRAKIALVRQCGMTPEVVTQFSFEAEPILAWLSRASEHGADAPVRIGLAGPASMATLAKFAVRCGIGRSMQALLGGQTSIARLVLEAGPEWIVRSLAEARLDARVLGLHFFSFGGAAKTATWMRAVIDGAFALDPEGGGFRVNRPG
jgi:methylenetetrahydrofolate reductase (NADPH)